MHGGGHENCSLHWRYHAWRRSLKKIIFFSCAKRRLPCYGSIHFFRNKEYMSLNSFWPSGTRKRPVTSFPIILPQIIATEPLCWCRILITQLSPLKTHPLSKPSGHLETLSIRQWREQSSSSSKSIFTTILCTCKSLFNGIRERILLILLIEAIVPMVWLRVFNELFCNLASLRIIPLVAPGILPMFFN